MYKIKMCTKIITKKEENILIQCCVKTPDFLVV